MVLSGNWLLKNSPISPTTAIRHFL